jgi:hypothetical protein
MIMKPLTNLFKIGQRIGLLALLIFDQSCCSYYKVAKASEVPATSAEIITANPKRYFILRTGTKAYSMDSVVLSHDKKELTCTLDRLPDAHKLHLQNGINGKMRYKPTETGAPVLNEVHLYIPGDSDVMAGRYYALALNKIQKIEVLEKDNKRTKRSHVLGGWGIAVGVTAVVLVGLGLIASANISLANSTSSFHL